MAKDGMSKDAELARTVSVRIAGALSGSGNITIGEIDQMIVDLLRAEREACAKLADEHLARVPLWHPDGPMLADETAQGYGNAASNIAAVIRARNN